MLISGFRLRGFHPLRPAFPDCSANLQLLHELAFQIRPTTPDMVAHIRFGLFPLRSPLLGESRLITFPAGT